MRYKVGDKVKVREDLELYKRYSMFDSVVTNNAVPPMLELKGKIVTIRSVGKQYLIEEDVWYWTDEMFEGYAGYVQYDTLYDKETIDYWRSLLKPEDLFEGGKKDMKDFKIVDINIIVPNKVVEVVFSDGKKEKMVCHEDDTFDLRDCLFIAIAKHLYKDEYTFEGIEYKAKELKYLKKYVKLVDSALKNYYKLEEQKKKLEKAAESAKEIELRKKAKFERRKAKRKEKHRNERIGEMIEAYVNAMMIVNEIACESYDVENEEECCSKCECHSEHDCECNYSCEADSYDENDNNNGDCECGECYIKELCDHNKEAIAE